VDRKTKLLVMVTAAGRQKDKTVSYGDSIRWTERQNC